MMSLLLLDLNQYATSVNSEHVRTKYDRFGNIISHIVAVMIFEIIKLHQMCGTRVENPPYVLRIDKSRILVEVK